MSERAFVTVEDLEGILKAQGITLTGHEGDFARRVHDHGLPPTDVFAPEAGLFKAVATAAVELRRPSSPTLANRPITADDLAEFGAHTPDVAARTLIAMINGSFESDDPRGPEVVYQSRYETDTCRLAEGRFAALFAQLADPSLLERTSMRQIACTFITNDEGNVVAVRKHAPAVQYNATAEQAREVDSTLLLRPMKILSWQGTAVEYPAGSHLFTALKGGAELPDNVYRSQTTIRDVHSASVQRLSAYSVLPVHRQDLFGRCFENMKHPENLGMMMAPIEELQAIAQASLPAKVS